MKTVSLPPAPGFMANWNEKSLFIPPGEIPRTQRQLNLYYYFLFARPLLEKISARKILELGAGRGTLSAYLASHLGLAVTLLDHEPAAIDLAQQNFVALKLPAEFVVGDALATGLPDESFDAIVSIGLAEHFPPDQVAKLFAEQYRLLQPGGVMISLNIPGKFSIQSLNWFNKLIHLDSKRKDYYRNDLRAADFARLARQAGFKKVSLTHVCPYPIWVPLSSRLDRWITAWRRFKLLFRRLLLSYPYRATALLAQAHFLVGYK